MNSVDVSSPRPTQAAFRPADRGEVAGWVWMGIFFLAIFVLGLLLRRTTDFFTFLETLQPSGNQTGGLGLIFLQILVYYGFPLFIPAAAVCFYLAWRRRQESLRFRQQCRREQAVITHLWAEPPSGSGKKYYAGFRYGQGHQAFQQVTVWEFKRLHIEDTLPVDYLPARPQVACLDLSRSTKKRTART